VVINPGALTHYSYALRDAIEAVQIPCVEVHLSDVETREDFRKISVTRDVCVTRKKGKGKESYFDAIRFLEDYKKKQE
jgi:3-dehydroquinate dehydratase-2